MQVDQLLAKGVNVTIYNGQVSPFLSFSPEFSTIFMDDLIE